MFKIEFIGNTTTLNSHTYEPNAKITIDSHEEYMEIDTSYWSREEFEKHWLRAVQKFLRGGDTTTLFVSMEPTGEAKFLEGWVLYKDVDDRNKVFVQNCLLTDDELLGYDSEEELLSRRDVRRTTTEDGDPISEWKTTTGSINEWAMILKSRYSS